MDAHIVKHVPYSTCARFVTLTIIFGLIGIVQWMYKIGFHERYVNNKIQDFVDLCTMGNISVLILAAKQYGFYIHGRYKRLLSLSDFRHHSNFEFFFLQISSWIR